MKFLTLVMAILLVLIAACGNQRTDKANGNGGSTGGTARGTGASRVFSEVQPILSANCLSCHSSSFRSGGVDLSSYAEALKVVSAGNPGSSSMFLEVDSGRMPRGGSRLSSAEIDLIFDWIKSGAKE